MFRRAVLFVLVAFLMGFPLAAESFGEEAGNVASGEFKVNGASFAECVSMADSLTEKGDELSAAKDFEKAIEYYNMAISINGNHAKALLSRGISYYKLGLNEEALADINSSISKAIAIEEQGASAFYFQGVIYSESKEYDKALDSLNKSIALKPEQAHALNSRGVAFLKKGLYGEAIDDYNAAFSIDSTLIEAINNRGDAYEQVGNYRKACRDWKRACDKELCDKFKFMELIGACNNG
jgi:tetratricopeptide (TPR) repeat protein